MITFLWISAVMFILYKTIQIIGWIIDSYDYKEAWINK